MKYGIKDEVNKVGLIRNLLNCKNKTRNSREAYKRAKEKNRQMEISKFQEAGVDIEKLKQTTTMNRLRLMKKRKIEKLEKT